jgi:hypothetical protein
MNPYQILIHCLLNIHLNSMFYLCLYFPNWGKYTFQQQTYELTSKYLFICGFRNSALSLYSVNWFDNNNEFLPMVSTLMWWGLRALSHQDSYASGAVRSWQGHTSWRVWRGRGKLAPSLLRQKLTWSQPPHLGGREGIVETVDAGQTGKVTEKNEHLSLKRPQFTENCTA